MFEGQKLNKWHHFYALEETLSLHWKGIQDGTSLALCTPVESTSDPSIHYL